MDNKEQEFKELRDKITPKIEAKLKIAVKALREAEALSDKHGIPFTSTVVWNSDMYYPQTYWDKWHPKLSDKFRDENELYGNEWESGGWTTSYC